MPECVDAAQERLSRSKPECIFAAGADARALLTLVYLARQHLGTEGAYT